MQLASMFRGPQPNSGGAFGQPYDARMPDTTQIGAPYDAKMPDVTQTGTPYDARMQPPAQPMGMMQAPQQQPWSLQNIYRNWMASGRGKGLY